jgi:hypothetical protein
MSLFQQAHPTLKNHSIKVISLYEFLTVELAIMAS